RDAEAAAAGSGDPFSPWAATDAWRPNLSGAQDVVLRQGADALVLRAAAVVTGWQLEMPDAARMLSGCADGDSVRLELDGVQRRISVVPEHGMAVTAFLDGRGYTFDLVDPLAPPRAEAAGGGRVSAPIPGYVRKILVEPGAAVARGQALVVLEAMKMELTLTAPADGVVESVHAEVGEMVEEGRELVLLAARE
ncbi:MAG: 3-methylcrotonyl-CoA carboxylase, partial [Alphaproteobacteria bacterium]|nr:3-methylcrotonyl-CoA carboxylase [Alphaproteobacteria bacterium]